MKAHLALLASDLRVSLRERSVLFFNYAFPLIFFFMFGTLMDAGKSLGGAHHQAAAVFLGLHDQHDAVHQSAHDRSVAGHERRRAVDQNLVVDRLRPGQQVGHPRTGQQLGRIRTPWPRGQQVEARQT